MTSRAILIDESIYSQPLEVPADAGKRQLNIQLYLTPSDIPISIEASYEKNDDIGVFTFQYNDEEKEKSLFNNNRFKIIVGQQSGKPLKIEIKNIKKDNIGKLKLTHMIREDIGNVIKQSINTTSNWREKSNLQKTNQLLEKNADELAASFA